MFIRKIRLIQEKGPTIREVKFHQGMNFVVDKEKSEYHNHVGKTTFLKLIDIALGSKDKKFLYTDVETGGKNIYLEKLIDNNKISVELYLCESFDISENIVLKVNLFKRGHKYINGEKLNTQEYNKELNKILFNNDKNEPSFRELIPYFVRVSARKDNYNFLRNLHQTTKKTTYREIYNYLFNISNSKSVPKLEKAKEKLEQFEKAEKNYRSLGNNNQQNDILAQKIYTNKLQQRKLENRLNDIIKGTDFLQNRDEITQARNTYVELKQKLDDLDYELKIISDDINATSLRKIEVNDDLTKDFFTEVNNLIPNVEKTYNDLVLFNEALKDNKINYLKNLEEQVQNKRKELHDRLSMFLKDKKDIISLVTNDDISKYDKLNKEFIKVSQNISKQEEILETLKKYSSEKDKLKKRVISLEEKVQRDGENFQPNLKIFNSYFTELVEDVNQVKPILAYHKDVDQFPVSVEELNEGTSSGTLKSLILCYDIAYQEFANQIKKTVPNFIVHDILESVSGEVLAKLIKKINSLNIQVVIAILKEKLDSSNINENEQKNYTILTLSNHDRVFDTRLIEE